MSDIFVININYEYYIQKDKENKRNISRIIDIIYNTTKENINIVPKFYDEYDNVNNYTPLMYLIMYRHKLCKTNYLDIFNEFINWNANVNAISSEGLTPLLIAIMLSSKNSNNNNDIINILIDHGAYYNKIEFHKYIHCNPKIKINNKKRFSFLHIFHC